MEEINDDFSQELMGILGDSTYEESSDAKYTSNSDIEQKMIVKPYIANIVATGNCSCSIDIDKLSKKIAEGKRSYNPRKYSGLIFYLKGKIEAHIFPNGKIILLGTTEEEDASNSLKKVVNIIKRATNSKNAKLSDFKIQNVVGKCNVGKAIHLERFFLKYGKDTSYEPEIFPSLIYRTTSPAGNVICFPSGEIVLSGFEDPNLLQSIFDIVYPKIQEFLIDPDDI